ncbi:DNA ligase (ATP) [Purpureocillium lavendulum]|uniref:DNA ligase (ATP) n=1 Tax=Purpureocillium lavendulum TaxID=1247861 RepID=A0AB34FA06_9HYPO|nr:DNA ligase (ATP) [Purpureocillium lavendulum]
MAASSTAEVGVGVGTAVKETKESQLNFDSIPDVEGDEKSENGASLRRSTMGLALLFLSPTVTLRELDRILDRLAALSPFSSDDLRNDSEEQCNLTSSAELLSGIFRRLRSNEAKWLRKYDGEYCQIHVDLSNRESGIKIFSKGGRDSTRDRMGLHRALRESLKLGTADCAIKKQCILEGELLVWNDDTRTIAPFHRIRKHVRRSGRLLGAAQNSPVTANEHLMVMFYDLLLLDDTFCARESLDKRRHRLQSLVCRIPGHADIGSREVVTFSLMNAAEELTAVFARAITQRWEGLVLKGCDDPYFTFDNSKLFIKLKKDYIPGLGDSADFIIVGGHHNTDDEHDIGMGKLWWTAFYIGCVDNKDEVCRFDTKPRIRIIDIVDKYGISKDHVVLLNRQGYFTRMPFAMSTPKFDVVLESAQRLRPVELFTHPYIVELVGAGFDKPANTAYYTLRFPRVLKIHDDRSFGDTISFKELQEMAQNCLAMPDKAQREEKQWRERLCGRQQIDEE